jgi:predicted DNA-binding transcriptional regulator YafY
MAKTAQPEDYKGKLLRLFRAIMLLSKSNGGMRIRDLEEKLGVTYRTVYRDLQLLEQAGFYPEEISKGKYVIRGYDREARGFEQNLQFTAEEAGMLASVLAAVPESNPLKKTILEKMLAFSGMEDVLRVAAKTHISQNMESLSKAIREKRQAILVNYHSSHSQSIRNRKIEPYAFSSDGVFLKGFEHGSNTNKTYKIERIEQVTLLPDEWKFEPWHEKEMSPDIFGITSGQKNLIVLNLSLRAASLLREEYPLAAPFIYKTGPSSYRFEAECNSFLAIGRFVLGLMDEIEIQEPKTFIKYVEDTIQTWKSKHKKAGKA